MATLAEGTSALECAGKLGKSKLLARVASSRGGDVRVAVDGERVALGGHAVVTMTGTLLHTKC